MSTNYDWSHLDGVMNPETKRVAFTDVQHLFKKVAFDVYKQEGSTKLWELCTDDDGSQHLIALYDDDDNMVVESHDEKSWTATANADGDNITLSYNSTPIARFASSQYQYSPNDAESFADFIEKKALNQNFITTLLETMPEKKRIAVKELLQEGAN
jgi:hypothetical protein